MKDTVICIVGPTCSGKTSFGVELAKKIDGEIISADSMQIYKNLDIITAKVTKEEMQGIPHHLIDICNVDDSFSVADFKSMCYEKIEDILLRKKVPVIVGGTGLYISSVVNNMEFKEEKIDLEYRENLYKLAMENSNEYVYDILKKIDPKTAETIHPNNLKRVIRALEIARFSKMLKSEHMEKEKERLSRKDNKYNFLVYYIDYDRKKLYDRINKRVDIMVKNGGINEAKMVFDLNLNENCTCMQAIGYKEFFPYFKGEDSLENCVEKLKQETRKYAKRQITWFKNKLKCISINPELGKDKNINKIILDMKENRGRYEENKPD